MEILGGFFFLMTKPGSVIQVGIIEKLFKLYKK